MTWHPANAWVAPQLREATPYGHTPRFLIRDNDGKFGAAFGAVAKASGIEVLPIPFRAPWANAICERFLGSVKRECLDQLLILTEGQLYRVIQVYPERSRRRQVAYFNRRRPHQGLRQRIPDGAKHEERRGKIISFPVIGGLHHDDRRAA